MTDDNKCPKCGTKLDICDVPTESGKYDGPFRWACQREGCGYVDMSREVDVDFQRCPGIDGWMTIPDPIKLGK